MDRLLQDTKRKCVVLCFLQASITMLISKRAWALERGAHSPCPLSLMPPNFQACHRTVCPVCLRSYHAIKALKCPRRV